MKIEEKCNGRKPIYSCYSEITDENICDVIRNAYKIHLFNQKQINYLHRYLKGYQPILNRVKDIRPEINNKIVENHALEINNFKVGFMFGEPVQYVRRGDCNIDPKNTETNNIALLNEYMQFDNKSSKDRELAEWFNKCGVGYKIVLPSDSSDQPFETYVLDPRYTFIVRSNDFKHEPVLGVTYVKNKDFDKNIFYEATVYSKQYSWKIIYRNQKYQILDKKINNLGEIPIIEYRNNPDMIGSFENVLPLCDAINTITSNSIDGIEQVIQALIWFNNCQISNDNFKALRDVGAIQTKSDVTAPADIKVIKTDLNQTETQVIKDDLYQKMLTIASVPDRRASAGGNTGQALIIGEGWVMAESSAKALEPLFISSEKQLLKIVLKICKDTKNVSDELKNIELHDIEVKFTRNKTDNLLVKTQALMNLLQAGIHPRIAIAYCGLFSDPEQVYQDSKETLEKIAKGETSDINEVIGKSDIIDDDPLNDEVIKLVDKLQGVNNADK